MINLIFSWFNFHDEMTNLHIAYAMNWVIHLSSSFSVTGDYAVLSLQSLNCVLSNAVTQPQLCKPPIT